MERNTTVPALTEQAKQLGLGAVAGWAATVFMGAAMNSLASLKSEEDREREREKKASKGSPTRLAVEKAAQVTGIEASDETLDTLAQGLHYAVGASGGIAFSQLHRKSKLGPLAAGLATGTGIWLVLDETVSPALGLTAPPNRYPLSTHLTAFLGHLAYGVGLAAAFTLLERGLELTTGRSRARLRVISNPEFEYQRPVNATLH